jgi:Pyruvate/2-oxoacid:ferredoxin oxidoreductase delta subunit
MYTDRSDKSPHYYTEKELGDIADSLESAVTLPVNVEIEADHRVFDLSEVEKILRDSEYIFLNDCGCRSIHKNCDNPIDTCIAVNVGPDYPEKSEGRNSRRVTVEEALDALRHSHEAGLVHMAYVMKGDEKPFLICSCCTCCCHTLGGLLRHGIHTQVLTSKSIAEDDESRCVDCGECVKRCVFGARRMADGEKRYDEARCFGCGLCVSTCPSSAIRLVERKKALH